MSKRIAGGAGGALIAVCKNHTRLSELAAVKEMLAAAGAGVIGAVINAY